VVGIVERDGKVKAQKQDKEKLLGPDLRRLFKQHVNLEKSILITDEYRGYNSFHKIIEHKTINHQKAYVRGDVHTNTIESFWAILKRGIIGQYHNVSKKYLNNYLVEFCFKYNYRKENCVFDLLLTRALKLGGKND
jgi:hypothetical protein